MLSPSDLVHLPFTRDLTEGGIAYALRSLPHAYKPMGGPAQDGLRRVVAEAAVELAFRRYLSEQKISFEVKGAMPFTEPDHYDVSLAGRRCEIKSFFISRREQVLQLEQNPQILLDVPALVASDQHAAEGHLNSDIYLFAFVSGLVTASEADLQKVFQSSQPSYFVHILPESWARPLKWIPLGTLVLKSEADESQHLEIGGQEAGREMSALTIEIPPQRRVEIESRFFSLAYIHSQDRPNARLGVHSTARKETYVIEKSGWNNLWIYDMKIILAGYLTREEFNRRASFLREGARVFPYDRTRTKSLAVNVSELRPIAELLERVKDWNI
jgi:hypothetical protein